MRRTLVGPGTPNHVVKVTNMIDPGVVSNKTSYLKKQEKDMLNNPTGGNNRLVPTIESNNEKLLNSVNKNQDKKYDTAAEAPKETPTATTDNANEPTTVVEKK